MVIVKYGTTTQTAMCFQSSFFFYSWMITLRCCGAIHYYLFLQLKAAYDDEIRAVQSISHMKDKSNLSNELAKLRDKMKGWETRFKSDLQKAQKAFAKAQDIERTSEERLKKLCWQVM